MRLSELWLKGKWAMSELTHPIRIGGVMKRHHQKAEPVSPVPRTVYHRGVTYVGVPNKVRKKMGGTL